MKNIMERSCTEDWWVNKPWRQIQTNLREIDMLDIDAERYVADLQEFKATSVMINTSGIIASYPTKLPFHFQSPYLNGDSLQKIIEVCHDSGIKVFARTDFSKVRRPIYEEHPEWAYISPKGEIVDYNGDVHVCVNGDYQQKYALDIIKETLETLDVDGIFFNMGGYQVKDYSGNYFGICQCESCRKKFYDMFGYPLPQVEDHNDIKYRKYLIFKKKTISEYQKKMYKYIKSLKPDICIANNLEAGQGIIRQESNTAIERPLPHWQYSASDNTKWAVSSYPDMISSNTTVDFIDFPYRHVAVSPYQQALRLAQALANGGALDYYLMGRLNNHEDKSGYMGIKKIFHYHAQHEEDYLSLTSKATIGLINGPDANQSEFRGWFRFLAENHFLFDTIMTGTAMKLSWDKYKAIIVPDYKYISDELAKKLDEFALAGGTVIAVSESGFDDGEYEHRSSPALKCLGMEKVEVIREDMRSSYFKVTDEDLFSRFPVTDLIYMDGSYVYADYNEKIKKYFSLVPPHMFGPPERCYYTQVTSHPAFTVHTFGKGNGVYIPWKPGALFYRQGYSNTTDFIADLLENVLGLIPVKGTLPPMVEATVFEKKDGSAQLLHLINGTGHFGVSFFAPVTTAELEVSIPYEGTPCSVESLVTNKNYGFKADCGILTIYVPKLELMEAIKIIK